MMWLTCAYAGLQKRARYIEHEEEIDFSVSVDIRQRHLGDRRRPSAVDLRVFKPGTGASVTVKICNCRFVRIVKLGIDLMYLPRALVP